MATYEVEHSLPASSSTSTTTTSPQQHGGRARRPDFSTFFSTLALIDTSQTTNPHSVPFPSDISAAHRGAAEAYHSQLMSIRHSNNINDNGDEAGGTAANTRDVLQEIVRVLVMAGERPAKRVEGVGEEFLDGLERIPTKKLKRGMLCPICGGDFLDDEYPLVIRLPCHVDHLFDLECIAPWLKLNPTCPLDRIDLLKRSGGSDEKEEGGAKDEEDEEEEKEEEEEEEEWDDMYA